MVATSEFDAWVDQQTKATQAAVRYVLRILGGTGPMLGRPYADTLKGSSFANMKELRINANRLAIRIAFAFDPERNAVILVAGDKRGVSEKLFYRRLIEKADRLYFEYLTTR